MARRADKRAPVVERHPALCCRIPTCPATFGIGDLTQAVIWSARFKNWGILDDIVLCPEHSGRKRTRPPIPAVLDGQVGMFDLPDGAVVVKQKKNNRVVS